MLVKADLQKAMKEENIAEYSHILKDLNEQHLNPYQQAQFL